MELKVTTIKDGISKVSFYEEELYNTLAETLAQDVRTGKIDTYAISLAR